MTDLSELKESLPISFSDDELLATVFVHRSFLNEKEGRGLHSNERLEFLGDAILESAVSHLLFVRFPELNEGELTRARSRLVNKQILAAIARELELGRYLLMGKGEQSSGGAENDSILADTFEALIAAAYLDHGGGAPGFGAAFSFLEKIFKSRLDATPLEPSHFDFKPALQELTQARFQQSPDYTVLSEEGPPHKKVFEIRVSVDGRVLGRGEAGRKKDAEQMAAREALEELKREGEE